MPKTLSPKQQMKQTNKKLARIETILVVVVACLFVFMQSATTVPVRL